MRIQIKEARERAGLSQKELAKRIGVAPSTFHGYESGNHDPKSDLLIRIAQVCDCTVDFLLGVSKNCEEPKKEKASNKTFSLEAAQLAQTYDTLDQYGKDAVREVAEVEKARCEDEDRFLRAEDFDGEDEEIVIDEFTFRPAAGPLAGVAGQERIPYVLKPEDPRGAVYTTIVEGDSMEPYFPDGSRIFINMDQVRDGDVGVFCIDGAMVVKQYHHDPRDPLGMTYLFSLNRKRANRDIVFSANSGQTVVCQGRVMTKKHFPIPGR